MEDTIEIAEERKYFSLCMGCFCQGPPEGRPVMLTGYCMWAVKCEGCGIQSDCAITRITHKDGNQN